jgi:hypothetical protein
MYHHIEFKVKRYKRACEFEEWRKKYDNDEVRAWNEYRRTKAGGEQIQVVSILKYDQQSSSQENRNFSPGRGCKIQQATKPKGERDANSLRRQKSALIGAKSSKFEQETVPTRYSHRVRAFTSTKKSPEKHVECAVEKFVKEVVELEDAIVDLCPRVKCLFAHSEPSLDSFVDCE